MTAKMGPLWHKIEAQVELKGLREENNKLASKLIKERKKHEDITRELNRLREDMMQSGKYNHRQMMAFIAKEVQNETGMTLEDLRCQVRSKAYVNARQMFVYRVMRDTENTLPQIGKFLHRDHTTVLNAVRQYCKKHDVPQPRSYEEAGGGDRCAKCGQLLGVTE
jgi:chromosomal replication initiation ATPase DnaA